MKLLKPILVACILLGNLGVFAQNDSLNRQKYWCFRQRLVTKFIKPGLKPGESIPAKKYTIGVAWSSRPAKLVKKLEWGDATIHLGWYMSVMATELELLQRSGKTNDAYYKNLLQEIYFALNAFNRLDDAAEVVWSYAPDDCYTHIDKVEPVLWDTLNGCWLPKPGSGIQPQRNGFFIRSDGNANLLNYFTDASSINTSLVRPWQWKDSVFTVKRGEKSTHGGSFGFYACDPNAPGFEHRANGYYAGSEASQDQIFNLLMGLVLICEFVEEEIMYDGISLKLMAREIGLRLIGQYKGTEFRNPLKPNRIICNFGGNSFAFWQSIKKVERYFETGKKNRVKDQIYFWGKMDCKTSYQVNRALYVIISSLANTTPQQDLCKYSKEDGFTWGLYYLLRRAIYNPPVLARRGCNYTLEDVKTELGLCPFRGPHFDAYAYDDAGQFKIDRTNQERNFHEYTKQEILDNMVPLWHFSNRFYQICTPASADQKRFIVEQGEFNGLDYMLLYNLSLIVFGTDAMGGNYTHTREFYFKDTEMIIK